VTATYPELARLALLPKAGWRFQTITDENGELTCVVGWHHEEHATDALWIYDRTDCLAARLLVPSAGDPGGLVWRHLGDIASCVDELLALPGPHDRTAPRLVTASAPGLWTP
jgi:hypothetical protein